MNIQKRKNFILRIARVIPISFILTLIILTVPRSEIQLHKVEDQIRPYTIGVQFDFVTWTLDALWDKFSAASMNWQDIIPQENYRTIVYQYLQNEQQLNQTQELISDYYGNPNSDINEEQFLQIQMDFDLLKHNQCMLEPVYESLLSEQIRTVLYENELTLGNQAFPPVLFRDADLPYALILSPRDHIEQIVNLSLLPDLSLEQMIVLEERIESQLQVSALVVPVGGIGTYPTMIMRTTNFTYTAEVIQHEWIHNYLTLRPLGLNYETTPQLRTINETSASISGKELGNNLLAAYYPEFLPEPTPPPADETETSEPQAVEQIVPEEIIFDFRAEMHTTRLGTDQLLSEGKIDEAEAYMENRRLLFWENGYQIRKINQAYYAFYGAYADQPGGAAGNDPVGEAVRALRQQSASLQQFINKISWVTSFEQLQSILEN
ncbi:MAG: hypothetical protein JEZ00_20340 [Anaerolineaceae bacterium]|nr:hypothetical protein [Anaerolineaceae bacterium]